MAFAKKNRRAIIVVIVGTLLALALQEHYIVVAMNRLSNEQDSWPVQVYRYTTGKGWESVDNAGDIDSNDAITATPRVGGIEIRKFRVRIRLFVKQGDESTGSYGYASRRLDRIYCPSRSSSGGTSGALVLKFRDKSECIGFFDRLVALNPSESNSVLNDKSQATSRGDGDNSSTSRKRRMNPAIDMSCFKDNVSVKRRKFDIMSYIIRLLHDDSFLKFVDDIEETLMSTQDGAAILAAMKRSGKASSQRSLVVNGET